MAYYQYKDRRLHYQFFSHENSEVPLVIYLHGLLMDNLSSGYFTFAHDLKQHAHVLLFDLIGHGRSSMVKQGYAYEDHFQDIKELVKLVQTELKVKQLSVMLIGCSFGGSLALYASQYLENIQSVVLLEGHLGSPKFIEQLQSDLQATGDEAKDLIFQHFQHWLHRESERKRKRLMQRAHELIYDSSLLKDLQTKAKQELMAEPHSLDYIKQMSLRIKVPILYLYGEHSDTYSEALSLFQERQAHAHGLNDQFTCYPNRGHALLWEETQAISQALCHWLKS